MSVPLNTSFLIAREQAVLRDLLATEERSLASAWEKLVFGALRVVDTFFTNERCYVIIESGCEPAAPARTDSRLLQRIVAGECQNSIAIESGQSPSTIGLRARLALLSLGVDARPSRIHPLLMLAAASARDGDESRRARGAQLDQPGLSVLSIERPELRLVGLLPHAEVAIAGYLVEGLCYGEMAERRGTKVRTVANQITSIFRRFGLSGRNELVIRLLLGESSPSERGRWLKGHLTHRWEASSLGSSSRQESVTAM